MAAEYLVSNAMIEELYGETISSSGGLPRTGIIMDLIIKHFLGAFDAKTKTFTRESNYKGPPPQLPGNKNLPPAMERLNDEALKSDWKFVLALRSSIHIKHQ